MSGQISDHARAGGYPGRTRRGVLGILFLLCFLAGLAVAGFAARRFGWFGAGRTAEATTAAATVASPLPGAPAGGAMSVPALPAAGLPVLAAREEALAAQVASLEARAAAVTADAAGAGGQAARAEALLVTAAARRRVDRGEPLDYLEEQVRLRFPTEPGAVDLLIRAARVPVTLDSLVQELDRLEPGLAGGPPDEPALDRIRRELGGLVVLRRAGTPLPTPAERLSRARRMLRSDQVEGAVAQLSTLPGAVRASGWYDHARRYILARRALDVLERSALTRPLPPPPAPATDPLTPTP